LLENGTITGDDDIERVIASYNSIQEVTSFKMLQVEQDGFELETIRISHNGTDGFFDIDNSLEIVIVANTINDFALINVNLFFKNTEGTIIFVTHSTAEPFKMGKAFYQCIVPANTLNDNVYMIDVMVVENGERALIYAEDAIKIEGIEPKRDGGWLGKFPGLIRPTEFVWSKNKI
jgi:hypothetical protein